MIALAAIFLAQGIVFKPFTPFLYRRLRLVDVRLIASLRPRLPTKTVRTTNNNPTDYYHTIRILVRGYDFPLRIQRTSVRCLSTKRAVFPTRSDPSLE